MEIDKNQLADNNGKEGKPTYVAVDGKIYDLSESKMWRNGKHMNRHQGGEDLSNSFDAAPHGKEVLERFAEIADYNPEADLAEESPLPQWIMDIFEKHPFLKRHPHPMIVHFPMAFFITASLFMLWYYIISPIPSMLDSIFYMHILGTLSLPFAMITGWFAWKVNYMGRSIGYVTRKIIFSFVVVAFDIAVLLSLIYVPDILVSPQGIELLVPAMIISYLPIVSYIGQQGGQLVY
ncbi:hypothetical protein GF337_09180 [candidate division KSB1 bacterium]|nr:hypothetical protein [candidate division KSB1 bacterium]